MSAPRVLFISNQDLYGDSKISRAPPLANGEVATAEVKRELTEMTCLNVVLTSGRLDSNTFVLQCYVQLDLSIQVTHTSEVIVGNYKLIDIVSPLFSNVATRPATAIGKPTGLRISPRSEYREAYRAPSFQQSANSTPAWEAARLALCNPTTTTDTLLSNTLRPITAESKLIGHDAETVSHSAWTTLITECLASRR